jgi:hypothetical protein
MKLSCMKCRAMAMITDGNGRSAAAGEAGIRNVRSAAIRLIAAPSRPQGRAPVKSAETV